MIRVAMVMGKMCGGGVESVVMNYYRNIDRDQVQFDFIVDEDSTDVPGEEILSLGGRVFRVPPYRQLPQYLNCIQGLCLQEKWTVIHSHLNALSVFPLAAAKRACVPVRIAHSHSMAGKGEPLRNVVKGVLRSQANRFPTARFACSQEAGRWLFGANGSFDVIANAIELSSFAYDDSSRQDIRAACNVRSDALVIGHVGRFVSQKNQLYLLEIFARLVKERPNSILMLVGEGKQRESAQEWVRARNLQGSIKFLGQRADVSRVYSAFDVFVLPSLYEGLGMVAVEAQRAGLPCLLSDRVPKEVALTEEVSFLSLSSKESWVEKLTTMSGPRSRAVGEGLFRDYDIHSAAAELLKKYKELLS